MNNYKLKISKMKKTILTIALIFSFITHVYSQIATYDDIFINDEEFKSLMDDFNSLRSAIIYNNSIDGPNHKLRKKLSKIIKNYESYLYEGGANQSFIDAALYRGAYLDEVLQMNQNAFKVLVRLNVTNTHLGNLFSSDHSRETLIGTYNWAKDEINKAALYYKDLRRNILNVSTYRLSQYNEDDKYATNEPQNGKGFSGDKDFKIANSFYQGEFKDGKKHGYGVNKLVFNTNRGVEYQSYAGFYVNGLKHGQGTFIWDNGTKFVGEWREGKMYNGTAYNKRGAKICDYRNGVRQ